MSALNSFVANTTDTDVLFSDNNDKKTPAMNDAHCPRKARPQTPFHPRPSSGTTPTCSYTTKPCTQTAFRYPSWTRQWTRPPITQPLNTPRPWRPPPRHLSPWLLYPTASARPSLRKRQLIHPTYVLPDLYQILRLLDSPCQTLLQLNLLGSLVTMMD